MFDILNKALITFIRIHPTLITESNSPCLDVNTQADILTQLYIERARLNLHFNMNVITVAKHSKLLRMLKQ